MTIPAGRLGSTPADLQRINQVEELAGAGKIGPLMQMLDDPSWSVRRAVVDALALAGSISVAPLAAALRERRDSEGTIAAVVDALSAATAEVDGPLVEMVPAADAAVLADIAQILGRRRAAAALPTVIALSRHENDNVAVAAIEALGRIGGRAAVDSLVDAIGSGNFFRVFPAIDVLGRSGDPRAVEPLSKLLAEPQYAAEAARALGRTGDAAAVAPLMHLMAASSSAGVRLSAMALADLYQRHHQRFDENGPIDAAIGESEPVSSIARRLIRTLPDGDPAEQAAICFVLGALRDPAAVPALTGLLDAPDPVSAAAVSALGGIASKAEDQILADLRGGSKSHKKALLPLVSSRNATRDVVDCLGDDDPDVRALACQSLARIGDVTAVGALFRLLGDPDTRVAYAAVAAIQSLGSAETDRLAAEAARSADPRVRRAALRILAYFGSSAALDVFLTGLADPDERVRESAIQGLPLMDAPVAFEALLDVARSESERSRAAAMRSLGQRIGDLRASSYLLKGLADPDPWVRYYACQALGKLAFEPAAAAVVKLLNDPAGQVRVAAIEALSCLKSPAALNALSAAVGDDDADVRRAAIVGLGVARDPRTLPLILHATRSADRAIRLVALSALAGFGGPEVLDTFRRAASDVDLGIRTAAIGFLAATRGMAATLVLAGLLRTGAATDQIVGALALNAEGRVAGLMAALESADDEMAPALVSALTRLRRPEATAALFQSMKMQNVAARKAAATALAVLGSAEALASLRQAATDDPQPQVRQICSLLLAR